MVKAFRKRRTYGRRRIYRRRRTYRRPGKFTRRVRNVVRRMVEVKWSNKEQDAAIGTTFTTIPLVDWAITPPTQGTGKNNMIGNEIMGRRLTLRWVIDNTLDSSGPPQGASVRVTLFRWRGNIPSPILITDILDTNSASGTVQSTLCNFNQDNVEVIRDWHRLIASNVDNHENLPSMIYKEFSIAWRRSFTFSTRNTSLRQTQNVPYLFIDIGNDANSSTYRYYVNSRLSYVDI